MSRLLHALAGQERPPDQVWVIDGSPDDETGTVVREAQSAGQIAGLEYLKVTPDQRGLTRQRNVGVSKCSADLVAFLDDDTVPAADYFSAVVSCFVRHPQAIGVGAYIDEVVWERAPLAGEVSLSRFRFGGWQRREDFRWRVRRLLKLAPSTRPGRFPPEGHGRSVSFLPPDGRDHEVDFVMGGASTWRRSVFAQEQFSPYFEGYGLYEDLEFCLRVRKLGLMVLCTAARLQHLHDAQGRPDAFRYGRMVVRNGHHIWKRHRPRGGRVYGFRWWAISTVLMACRAADGLRGPRRREAVLESTGRLVGIFETLFDDSR